MPVSSALPSIPLIDVPAAEEPGLAAMAAEPARLSLLLGSGRQTYTPAGMRLADALSRRWAGRNVSPYAAAVAAVGRTMHGHGAYLMNHSYEWGCTAGAGADPALGGSTLLRTLDWPFDGLGRSLVVTRWDGGAGPYYSATWPGFVGVLTGLAPGRFAIAINQPPLPLPGWGKAIGWPAARLRVGRSTAMPPSHLLRQVFDKCRDFDDALATIRRTRLCIPAIFTLAGPLAGQTVVVERTATRSFQPAEPVAANHWASKPGPAGRPRHPSSPARRTAMCGLLASLPGWSLDWLEPPMLQADTRLVLMANPATGRMLLQGWERSGPATTVLRVG